MDQRKVNMLAREYCDAAEPKIKFKPVILSHHMLMGLKEGQEKMSKSDPDSAIFMEVRGLQECPYCFACSAQRRARASRSGCAS
jgi:tyrosyl-tRNA synthetase